MTLIHIALIFFLVANPIGNSPAIIALIKDFPFERQKAIMFREAIFALLIALFFQYFGNLFLGHLNIKDFTVTLCGGILLLIVAINMIIAPSTTASTETVKKEPLIVPIATPLISGPALLTIIMLYTQKESHLAITASIFLAWILVTAVLVAAPYFQRILGKRGLAALEQLMGLLLALMAMEMIVNGTTTFINKMETL